MFGWKVWKEEKTRIKDLDFWSIELDFYKGKNKIIEWNADIMRNKWGEREWIRDKILFWLQ
jgi:hypothetical protein